MRKRLLFCFILLLLFLFNSFTARSQAIDIQDSLALVDFYDSTNGPNWTSHSYWLDGSPVNKWKGIITTNGRVTGIVLSDNNLVGKIPASIGSLSELTELALTSNPLAGIIPLEIGALSHLSTINLIDNQLIGAIPSSLENLHNLTSLYLYHNRLSSYIPGSLGNLSQLRELDLSANQLTGDIPSSLGNLSQLSGLYAYNNQLSGSIPSSLGNLANLTDMQFDRNQLTGNIPASLGNLAKLRRLELEKNQLSGAIPVALQNLGKDYIDYIDLSNNYFTFDGMEMIAQKNMDNAYSPQHSIPLNFNNHILSVSAGGILANDTFRLYKDNILSATRIGDSTFPITLAGQYHITVTNNIATKLTLFSDTIAAPGLALADASTDVIQSIAGTDTINVEEQSLHKLLLTLTPTPGANPLNGDVDCKVTIDPMVASYNNQPYVERHYDITPAIDAANAVSNVKLYFTQQEFDNFNGFPAHGFDLPANSSDVPGIANLRVYQYHGFSTTSLPGTYNGAAIEIDPDDANIVWNAAANYWEVSFDVTGFSGFFVSSQNSALLPLKLLSFTGKLQGNNGLLQWITSGETNTSHFGIQRSIDGSNFKTIATMNAGNSNGSITYQYADLMGNEPFYYYRLKMIDTDNRFTYSRIIKLTNAGSNLVFMVSPNPAREFVLIKISPVIQSANIKLVDMSGHVVQKTLVQPGITQIKLNLKGLPAGSYKLVFDNGPNTTGKTLIIE